MTKIEPEDQEETALDPAMESVRRKMVRLQIVSGVIMFVSLMAVFGAVVYKTMKNDPAESAGISADGAPSDAPIEATVSLPLGFVVQSTAFSGSQIMFFGLSIEGKRKAIIFDVKTKRTVADVTIAGN
jgi:hypothetical protein